MTDSICETLNDLDIIKIPIIETDEITEPEEQIIIKKRGRGRPRKEHPISVKEKIKKKRGRPRKEPVEIIKKIKLPRTYIYKGRKQGANNTNGKYLLYRNIGGSWIVDEKIYKSLDEIARTINVSYETAKNIKTQEASKHLLKLYQIINNLRIIYK